MRNLRSINKVNEDNNSGFHSNIVTTGFDRGVTGGNDAPVPVTMPQFKESVKKAKDTLMGKSSSGSNGPNIDDHSITNIYNNVNIDNSVNHSSVGDGLAWFGAHWKEAAIVAGAAALILAISKLIKGLNKSIKIRYNRVVKTLQRAQKDFTLKEDGLNMKSVMPGIGSRIYDWISRMWTGNWKSKKHKNGNIGLHPFCSQYIEEIEMDFRTAQAAFSKIKLGADESKVDDDRNKDASVGGSQHNVSTSAYSGKVYSSFHEAYSEEFLNEGVSPDKVDESVLAMISAGVALTSLAVRAGQFLYQRYKNGKPVGEAKQIQVTKESTREICYAIINNYADKYVNMQQVFREIGINSKSLADIDTSACDKLAEILKKYQKPEKNSYTKQYERIEKAYRKMLKHYYAIGEGIISNFVKYSEDKDEKHSNLIVASKEKLENMWDSQRDFYDNNFSHVLIEIVSSEAYINYLDFIIEKVIPVFKSGLASDADYVLDVLPRKGEYYLLRQTGNGQALLGDGEVEKGNVAIAEVLGCDPKTKNMKFKLVGLVKGQSGDSWEIGDDGVATLSTGDIDYDVYKEKGEFDEAYGKWLSLDPVLLDWTPERYSSVFYRYNDETKTDQYLYAYTNKEDQDKGYSKIVTITTKKDTYEIISVSEFNIVNFIEDYTLKNILDGEDIEHKFTEVSSTTILDSLRKKLSYYSDKKEPEDIKNTDELIKKLNEKPESDQNKDANVKAESPLYARVTHTSRGREIYEYMFAMIEADEESLGIPMKDKLNEEGDDDSSTDDSTNSEGTPVIEPGTDNAKKDLVKTIFVCNIDVSSGKTIADPVTENKFDGSSIEIDPACSIDEFDDKATGLKFKKVDKNSAKIKQIILGNILKQTGSVQKASSGKVSIDQLDKAIEEMENREGSSDKLTNDAGEIAQKIIDEYNKLGVGDDWFDEKSRSLNRPDGSGYFKGLGARRYVKKEKMKKPYFTFDTGIKIDGKDDNVIFYIIPTLIKEGNNPKINTNIKHGIIIYYNENIFQEVQADSKDDIETAIKNINDALVHGKHIESSRFAVAQGEGQNNTEIEGKIKADVESLFKHAVPGHDPSTNTPLFDIKAPNDGNVEIIDPKKAGPSQKVSANLKGCNIVILAEIVKDKVKVSVKYNGTGVPAIEIPADSWSVDNLAKELVQVVQKSSQKESVNVTYSHSSEVSESYSTNVNITRKFDKRMRKWFVLSEAIYDDGSNKVSKLDNPRFRKALLERSDCAGFAKTSKLAKFMPYDLKQNYTLVSEHNYTPSVATPLYESVMLVKFDKMDRITEKNYLGKHKIG